MINKLLQRVVRKACALMAVLLVTGAMTGQAHAQVFVTDKLSIATQKQGQFAQMAQMAKDYAQMVMQYEAMLTSLKSLNLNVIPTNNQLQLITDPSAQVQQACPGASSVPGMVAGALGVDTSIIDGEIVTQQRSICAKIVLLQVDKYNTVATMLNHMNDYFSNLQKISTTFDSLVGSATNAIGNRDAVQAQTNQTQTTLAAEMANVEQHLRAVDATIAALKDQQSLLANVALKGSNSGLKALGGQLVQAAAFAAAFQQH